jgi:DNA-binding LacI/PurR family transcriptional regulator
MAGGGARSGENEAMGKVTLQTIADRVGVSRMTVSNAFSRPDQLSSDLRDRILAAADALGYAGPDPAARVLATGSTGAVGVLLTDSLSYAFGDEFAAQFLGAIAEELAPTGLALTLLTSSGRAGNVPARDVPMDGAVVYSCDETSSALSWLRRRRLPLVFVDQPPTDEFPTVNIDDRRGARLAAQHLIDLGHRNIAIVTSNVHGPEGILDDVSVLSSGSTSAERMLGWLDALTAAGVEPVIVQHLHTGEHTGRRAAELIVELPERPTAVLCFSDSSAYGVVQAAVAGGLSVPSDISVVGFDDAPLARRMHPPLTTIRQDAAAKGRVAAAELVASIEHARKGTTAKINHHLLDVEIVVRESTSIARPRRASRRR